MYPDRSTAPSAHSAILPHFLAIPQKDLNIQPWTRCFSIPTSSAHQWLPSQSHPSTISHSIWSKQSRKGGYSPELGMVLTWPRRAAHCSQVSRWDWAAGEIFFLFAVILFVKLLEWMTVRATAHQCNRSVLLTGNQTNRLIMTSRNTNTQEYTQQVIFKKKKVN